MDASGNIYMDDPENIPEVDKERLAQWTKAHEAAIAAELWQPYDFDGRDDAMTELIAKAESLRIVAGRENVE